MKIVAIRQITGDYGTVAAGAVLTVSDEIGLALLRSGVAEMYYEIKAIEPEARTRPFVSCIMPTNRPKWAARAIREWNQQTYRDRELIVVVDGEKLETELPPGVRVVHLDGKHSVGAKRNIACELARGGIIAHVDDDDWYAPNRLDVQVRLLESSDVRVVGFRSAAFFDTRTKEARLCTGCVLGASFVYWRGWWESHRFANHQLGEDVDFWNTAKPKVLAIEGDDFLVCRNHAQNTDQRGMWKEWRLIDIADIPEAALADLR